MEIIEITFWTALMVVFYTYMGYAVVAFLITRFKTSPSFAYLAEEDLPEVTHVIAAYNEQDLIEDKIRNCELLDYPQSKIKTIIVADGSTDQTTSIIKKFPSVKLYYRRDRKGKLAAVDRVMKDVTSPITIFSDANSMLNTAAVKLMVRHFQNNQVGAVAGEKVVVNQEADDAAGAGEGIYWRYESFLKKLDYRLHSVVGAAGELFAVRTHLFETPAKNVLIEDFIITMRIAEQGYRVAYESNAKASEYGSANIEEEMKRKVRISAGGLQAVWMMTSLINPFKHGWLSFQYISHRALRWTLAPLSLVVLIFTNTVLVSESRIYTMLLFGQTLLYAFAIAGYYTQKRKLRFKAFFVPFYFGFMNFSVFMGLVKLITGKFQVTWDKAERRPVVTNAVA